MIQRSEGWGGVNGLFRFLPDGSAERALAIMQLQNQGGVKTIVPAQQTFGSAAARPGPPGYRPATRCVATRSLNACNSAAAQRLPGGSPAVPVVKAQSLP